MRAFFFMFCEGFLKVRMTYMSTGPKLHKFVYRDRPWVAFPNA